MFFNEFLMKAYTFFIQTLHTISIIKCSHFSFPIFNNIKLTNILFETNLIKNCFVKYKVNIKGVIE